MEAVKSLLKPKPTPQQQLREWQRRLRNEGRNIDRQIRGWGFILPFSLGSICPSIQR
jgi:charged multivesicular body protein 3